MSWPAYDAKFSHWQTNTSGQYDGIDIYLTTTSTAVSPNAYQVQIAYFLADRSLLIRPYNVKIYGSLKRGVYRPDSTYETAKIIHQKYSH